MHEWMNITVTMRYSYNLGGNMQGKVLDMKEVRWREEEKGQNERKERDKNQIIVFF